MHRSQRASFLIAALGAASAVFTAAGLSVEANAAETSPSDPTGSPNTAAPAGAEVDMGADPAATRPARQQQPATQTRAQVGTPANSLITATPAQKPPLEVELSADVQGYDLLANRYVATGNVRVLLSGGRLLADRLEYDSTTRTINASGRVRFQRGSHYLQASRLRYSLIENSGELEEAYGVLDLDSSAFDLNPAAPPSSGLLPLSYWDTPTPGFDGQLRAEPATAGPGRAPVRSIDPILERLTVQPLAQPGTGREPTLNVGQNWLRAQPVGTPEPLAEDRWRMPPVALSPAAQTMACPPPLPPLPDWRPHPWAATVWGGQMIDSNFGETFVFKGRLRPEYLLGLGLNRRLFRAGPLALEFDSNAMLHRASTQPGGEFNQSRAFADSPAQTFGEFTLGFGLRAWLQPWLSLGFVEGVSLNTSVSNYEKTFREDYSTFLNYLGFEVEALVTPQLSMVGRIHHRSGAYGTYSGVSEGSNAYLLGLRYRYGAEAPRQLGVAMNPPNSCPGETSSPRQTTSLAEKLNQVAIDSSPATTFTATTGKSQQVHKTSAPVQSPRQQEASRRQSIGAIVDQRINDLQFQQSLRADRRFGAQPDNYVAKTQEVTYGAVRPAQLQPILTEDNRRLVSGTISRWRMQANRITVTPNGWRADRAAFSNDPFTPAQAWMDAEGVVATIEPNGDLVIQSRRNVLILEDRLPLPTQRNQRFEKKKKVQSGWVLASDGEDRDGAYIGYNAKDIKLSRNSTLRLQPQFMVRRALDGTTDSYILPGQSAGDAPSSQPTRIGDLFGLLARFEGRFAGLTLDATADISTFDPSNFANGARSWGNLSRDLRLPWIGLTTARGFAAYRYRVWNGSLGEEDVYSAAGVSLEQAKTLPNWGRLSNQLYWRAGIGNFQADDFQSTNLADLWRGSLFASLNSSLPLWTGKPIGTITEASSRYTPTPIVPGLTLKTNTTVSLAYYGDGSRQNLISFSGGPTLTLGRLQRNWLDYTELTITGGGTLREGVSPFSFDRAVDLATVGIGLTQQLVGPLMISGGIGVNVDASSEFFGDTVDSYVELRWQRRAYEFAVYYSPYQQIGGVRVKLNDFNFTGTGLPFVPYTPFGRGRDPASVQQRGF